MADEHQYLLDMLIPLLDGTVARRQYIELMWLLNQRAWNGWPTFTQQVPLPDGGVHYYIPHVRRAVERNVNRAVKLLMPNKDWHQTLAFDSQSHENAEAVHNAIRYIYSIYFTTRVNLPFAFMPSNTICSFLLISLL